MHRSCVTVVLVLAACAGRAAPPVAPSPTPEPALAPEATTAPVDVTPLAPVAPLALQPEPPAAPPPAANDEPDPAAVAEALAHATLTVHATKTHEGVWPAELDVERGPTVFLVDVDLELSSFALRIDPDKFLLETATGDIVSQSPIVLGVSNGRMTAMFVVGNALQAKSVVVSYEGKRSKPFKLPRR